MDPRGADLLAAYRDGMAAPVATREQLLSRVEASAAAGTSRAWLAGLAVLLLGGVTVAAWPSASSQVDIRDTTAREPGVVTRDSAAEPLAPVVVTQPMAPAVQDDPVAEPPAPEEPTVVVTPDEPEQAAAPVEGRRSKNAPKQGEDAPPTELELIARAKKALAAGKARSALTATREHATAYPKGVLVEERLLLEIEARCALGQTGRVDELRDRFLAKHSSSPLADRVRHSCQEKSR